jgi:hypothetical protein
MKIKSAKSFRFWYKTKVKEIDKNSPSYNENFIGTYHNDKENGKKIKGFFEMYHGDKPNIADYLPSILKIAEDGQAIYEFLQNAVDCNSTHFYIFYDEKYFLAINNGEPFDIEGLQSILNIAQTTKKDADSIGRFGIGFKLAHRLVGKNEGTEELVSQYKGPVLFSWSKLEDLEGLIRKEAIEEVEEIEGTAPCLVKLLLTNFPAAPNEKVKDLQYQDRVLFSQEELNEMIGFLNENFQQHSDSLNLRDLQHGSMFFIKLGEGKKAILDKNYTDLENGIQYSMNMLKKLNKVYINDKEINKIPLNLVEGVIKKDSNAFEKINPEYEEFDIKFAIGYNQFENDNPYAEIQQIKAIPNFYKYFPMGDEINGFGFMLHCDSFSNEVNRRKLQQDEVNKNLFPEIANHITNYLDNCKQTDRKTFLNLYTCLLLSDIPDKQNNSWLRPIFYDTLLQYTKTNIPTKGNQYANDSNTVKIKKLNSNINLSELGLGHIQWFEWDNDADQLLIDEAKKPEKLGIETWDIRDIIENADLKSINNWIANCDNQIYEAFLNELESSSLRQKTKEKICNLKLFKFSGGVYYSFNDIVTVTYDSYRRPTRIIYHYANVVIINTKTNTIKSELEKIGFITSDRKISDYPNLYSCITMPAEKSLYDLIAEKCKTNTLTSAEKKKLFLNFINEETKFTDVGETTLKELCLFADKNGAIKPLKNLISSTLQTPEWLQNWIINSDEDFSKLNSYLIAEAEIYPTVILNFWDDLITQTTDINNLYKKTIDYYKLKDSNISLWKKNVKFVYTKNGFMQANQVFFNSKMVELGNSYVNFQNTILSLYGLPTPEKSIVNYLLQEPFRIGESSFLGSGFNKTQLDVTDIKAAIQFCKLNNEQFFKSCIIEKSGNVFSIFEKSDKFQITSRDEKARRFIDKYCAEKLFVLPYDFLENKEEDGIVKNLDLYTNIIDCVEVSDLQEELIDIISPHYVPYQAKLKFLNELSEIRLSAQTNYSNDCYEYKVFDIACNVIKESQDLSNFRNKIVIESNGSDLSLSEIPPSADKVVIGGKELSQSQILPNKAKNGNVLSDLLEQFITMSLQREKLYELFGIQSEADHEQIFKLLKKNYTVLENGQQLAFLLLYDKEISSVNLEQFKVETLDEKSWELKYSYYTQAFSFIGDDYLLKPQYSEIKKLLDLPVKIGNSDNRILSKPYFSEDNFVCAGLKSELSEEEKINFIDFLYSEWSRETNKPKIKKNDWSKINDTETEKLLGFNPNTSVYPNEYTCDNEQLPEYLIEWLGNDEQKIRFLSDMGVWVENSVIVELRKFLKGEIDTFNKTRLSRTSHFNNDETMLFNSFEWLKENEIELQTEEQYETFKKVVEVINSNRNNGDLLIQEEFEFDLLDEESEEWEKTDNYSIYLYNGIMPKIVRLDGIDEYIFYRYNDGDFAVNDPAIYINSTVDEKKVLQKVASDDSNDFSFEDLWALFGENSRDTELAEKDAEIARLRSQLQQRPNISQIEEDIPMSDNLLDNTDENTRISIHEEAQQKIFETLKDKGYIIPSSLDRISFTIVNGITNPKGQEVRIVTKSAKGGTIYFTPFEWLALCEPDSQLFIISSGNQVNNVTIEDLETTNDKFHLRFNTEIFAVNANLKVFAQLVSKLPETHFLFKAPINTMDFFKPFGLDEKNPSAAELSPDDIILLE